MKFEYLVIELENSLSQENLEEQLDMNGYESWELVNVINCGKLSKFIFKRELKPKQ